MALYILHNKKYYKASIVSEGPDFSDMTGAHGGAFRHYLEALPIDELARLTDAHWAPDEEQGDRWALIMRLVKNKPAYTAAQEQFTAVAAVAAGGSGGEFGQ